MGEWRQDPLTGDWAIMAPERGRRPKAPPSGGTDSAAPPHDPECPFCPGNEAELAELVHETPGQTAAGWATRVVENKYPAVTPAGDPASGSGQPALGRHQVIVETPRHDGALIDFDAKEMSAVIAAYRERHAALSRLSGSRAVLIFRNHGRMAGASLSHPHSQVVALDRLPPAIRRLRRRMRRYYRRTGHCRLCAVIAGETRETARYVAENTTFRAFAAYAATAPFETWIVPRRHMGDFSAMTDSEASDFGALLQRVLRGIARCLDDPPYNYVIDSPGIASRGEPALHWRLRIRPNVSTAGGFEMGAGAIINPALPEGDAAALRAALEAD